MVDWDFFLKFKTIRFVVRLYQKAFHDDIFSRAAQVAFYFSFAIFPLLLFSVTLFGLILGSAGSYLVARIGILMPPPPGFASAWLLEPLVVPSVMAMAFLLSVVSALLASIYTSYRASRLEVAASLRHVS